MIKKIGLFILFAFVAQINAQETAESAFRNLVSSLAEGDFEKALKACVVDEYAGKLDYSALVNSRKAFVMFDPIPPTSELYRQINRASRIEDLARQFKFFCFGFTDNPDVLGYCSGVTQPLKNQKQIEDFIAATNRLNIKDLSVKKVVLYPMVPYIEKLYQTNRTVYACDSIRDGIALLELNGKFYGLTFQAFKYGDDWKIYSLYATALGCSSLPAPKPITEDEFNAAVKNLKY
jgi:hypothetical protein